MATVDLDKLSAELTAAGRTVSVHEHNTGQYLLVHNMWLVYSDGEFQVYPGRTDDGWWRDLDIIRRHVAPVAPDPGLREVIAEVVNSRLGFDGMDADEWDDITDAVLSVLAERGVR